MSDRAGEAPEIAVDLWEFCGMSWTLFARNRCSSRVGRERQVWCFCNDSCCCCTMGMRPVIDRPKKLEELFSGSTAGRVPKVMVLLYR